MNIRNTLAPIVVFACLSAAAAAADLRITDSTGVELTVRNVSIDYGGMLGTDKETEGIRVSQGNASVTAKWADMESLTITGRDAAAERITIEIALKGGKKVAAMLVRKGRMKIAGKSDLGDYTIDLEKVKKIAVVAAK